jgi:hypothetical protein
MFKSQNGIFELCRKVRRIKIALSFKTKFIMFTFTLLPSIGLFLYCIKMDCSVGTARMSVKLTVAVPALVPGMKSLKVHLH